MNSILEPLPLIRQYQERGAPGALLGCGRPQTTQQQDWILKCLQGRRAHPVAACGLATLCCSPAWKGWGLESRHSKAGATPQQDWILKCLQGRSILSRPGDVHQKVANPNRAPRPGQRHGRDPAAVEGEMSLTATKDLKNALQVKNVEPPCAAR